MMWLVPMALSSQVMVALRLSAFPDIDLSVFCVAAYLLLYVCHGLGYPRFGDADKNTTKREVLIDEVFRKTTPQSYSYL